MPVTDATVRAEVFHPDDATTEMVLVDDGTGGDAAALAAGVLLGACDVSQAGAVLAAGQGTRLQAYVTLSLLAGIRTKKPEPSGGITWWPSGWVARFGRGH